MNKKGTYGLINFPLGLIGFFILMLIIISLLPIQEGAEVEDVLYSLNKTQHNTHLEFNPDNQSSVIIKVTYSFVDFVAFSAFEITKAAVSYGTEHQDFVNAKTLLWLVFIALFAPIALVLFKFIVIIVILIKEFIQSRREKALIYKHKK